MASNGAPIKPDQPTIDIGRDLSSHCKRPRRAFGKHESCTLYEAIALLAYRDADLAQRYGAEAGVRASGRAVRNRDLLCPTASGLPGTDIFRNERDPRLRDLISEWEGQDRLRWVAAKELLWQAVNSGEIGAFSESGRIQPDFWLTRSVDCQEVEFFRFRRDEMNSLLSLPDLPSVQFEGGYASRMFVTDEDQKIAELHDAYVLVYEKTIHRSDAIIPLMESIVATKRALLVVAHDVVEEALAFFVTNKRYGVLKVAAVRVLGSGEQFEAVIDRIASVTGATVLNEDLGCSLRYATLDSLGTAQEALITRNLTTIIGGGGKAPAPVSLGLSTGLCRDTRTRQVSVTESAHYPVRNAATETAHATANRRGPRPEKREQAITRMVADYCGQAQSLADAKQEFLASRYGASRDTVQRARRDALKILSEQTPTNSNKTPTIDN